ncbi:C-X-C motif chemokine ligand 16 [Phyllostomus discolor]|uniref:C-X-C motif chemokine 16 n=2 Tax=Phyllostomus discolor TaxID=89673 RepID=A0A6J2NJ83_9CHIR|nr:C-X-C motif chemokine 16 [Phyllostomus discolor]KAF6093195.1 C-X-C motif chemokine ligand 16 [Phyllostomus discolor]
MRRAWRPQFLGLLLLLAALTLPGSGNEGSSAGSCHCDITFPSNNPPTDKQMTHFRKQLKHHTQCTFFVRFHLPRRTVCGGSSDPWVTELISCIKRQECGHPYSGGMAHQDHLPPPGSQVPKSAERTLAVTGISAQTYLPPTLQSTPQPTHPGGILFVDKKLIHTSETTTSSAGHSLEAGENKKRLEENMGPTGGTPAMVPVLSLLAISFILTAALFYVLCKGKSKKSLQCSPDLQLQYTPVAPDSQHLD